MGGHGSWSPASPCSDRQRYYEVGQLLWCVRMYAWVLKCTHVEVILVTYITIILAIMECSREISLNPMCQVI